MGPRVQRASGFPCALCLEEPRKFSAKLGRVSARGEPLEPAPLGAPLYFLRQMMRCMIAGNGTKIITMQIKASREPTTQPSPGGHRWRNGFVLSRVEKPASARWKATASQYIAATCSPARKPSGQTVKLSEVQVLTPCEPSKMICLWNNFHQLAAKNDFTQPKEPLWFLKAPNAYWPGGKPIQRPSTYAGKSFTRANSASSSARNASTSRKPRPAITSSATPASTTSPPSTSCARTSHSSNGRAPRASTPSAYSVP